MKLCVVGVGYVGLVSGACFAEAGNHVICVDSDARKIEGLRRGEIPIYERGLEEIVRSTVKAGRLRFTTDLKEGVSGSDIIFLAVGTPMAPDGSANLDGVRAVAHALGTELTEYRVIVMKSTVPVGTHETLSRIVRSHTSVPFDYVSNPEFLKEGAAVEDFMRPDRIIIGTTSPRARDIMAELYKPFMRKSKRVIFMDPASAEMTKYAANGMLATRISFMNEIAMLCEQMGADVELVRQGLGSDSRIGSAFLFPGIGFGGSCFPKDIHALIHMGRSGSSRNAADRGRLAGQHRGPRPFRRSCDPPFRGPRAAMYAGRVGIGVQSEYGRYPRIAGGFLCSAVRGGRAPGAGLRSAGRSGGGFRPGRGDRFADGRLCDARRLRRPGCPDGLAGVPHAGLCRDPQPAPSACPLRRQEPLRSGRCGPGRTDVLRSGPAGVFAAGDGLLWRRPEAGCHLKSK